MISSAYNLSRKDSLSCVKLNKVKINWKPINKSNHIVNIKDLVSVSGYGRFIFDSILGRSKKNKYWIRLELIK